MRPVVSKESCTGCGTCKNICPANPVVFEVKDKSEVVKPAACIECKGCEINCPTGSIKLQNKFCPGMINITSATVLHHIYFNLDMVSSNQDN